jgi:uncharacterized protein (DUF1697 family)
MPRLVAFLRAINVGGHTVRMEELRRLFASLGCKEVETFIASGNVIFTSRSRDTTALERKIEKGLHVALGYEVATFLRTEAEVAAIASQRPFKESQVRSAAAYNVGFFAERLAVAAAKALQAQKTDDDEFHVHGREAYWLCRKKQSEATFSSALLERTLRIRVTWRGMSTVSRLVERYGLSSEAVE